MAAVAVLERLAESPHRPRLVVTRPDRPKGRGRKTSPPPVAEAAQRLGIGLAATQVGVMNRVLVYRVDPDAPVAAVVNPVLEWASEEREPLEVGCLSLPGVLVEVERPIHVRVRARDEHAGQ